MGRSEALAKEAKFFLRLGSLFLQGTFANVANGANSKF